MRISSSPVFSGNVPQVTSGELADTSPVARNLTSSGGDVQFGQSGQSLSDLLNNEDDTGSSAASFFSRSSTSSSSDFDSLSTSGSGGVSSTGSVASTGTPASSDASDPANAPQASDAAFLDNSEYSSPEALKRWEPMVAHLPPEEREQAAKELNRPIAAAWMARDDGPDAAKAMEFINANPALKTAVDTAQGGRADGKITNKDLKVFAKNMQKAADSADKDVEKYQKDNPDADPQSLEMVRNAAVMRANVPLARAAEPNNAQGAANQTKVDDNISAEDLKGLAANNPGLSGALKRSCSTWSQPGFMGQLDEAGMKGRAKAAHSPDHLFNAKNINEWIKTSAPTNGGQFAGMLSDAATLNSVAGIDISKLGADVFDHPDAYTGAQKAAVMVKLQQIQQSVVAGRGLRNTDKTEEALNERIAKLQSDQGLQEYLNKSIPEQERKLVRSDAALQKAVVEQANNVDSGKALETDMATAGKAVDKHKPNVDYSGAISGLGAQLQLQKDLFPDKQVMTPDQVLAQRPDLQSSIEDSYVKNFSEGGAIKQLLDQKKVDANTALQTADAQKAAYDSVLPPEVTDSQHEDYVNSTMAQLQDSKKGRKFLEGKSDEGKGPSEAMQIMEQVGPKALQSVVGFMSVSDMLAQGNKLGATQAIYDSTKLAGEAVKGGFDAGAKMLGREASAGLGRMTGQLVGRAIGMVAGEATGLAAGAVLGAAIPVIGWAIDGAMALGFGISAIFDAVKKHKAQKAFDHNVDPTLEQFGIPKAH
ncbi:type III effector HrpK [Pseudomonas sp. CDFA 602]|uniref:HrpF/NolX family T3SS translocon protein n=1 Tax=Pseudomonas californiensis TaxID=2829823 RepID=UPI001E49F675|nr:HrpF/NolX family T3SS translocon protein [Pseudomonas californiensis]MCD5993864.1 type III effector HrpK [Pseudomonas californiensis]MCD5999633.1 type III effector HrpK [Pseudomonas californiensis]